MSGQHRKSFTVINSVQKMSLIFLSVVIKKILKENNKLLYSVLSRWIILDVTYSIMSFEICLSGVKVSLSIDNAFWYFCFKHAFNNVENNKKIPVCQMSLFKKKSEPANMLCMLINSLTVYLFSSNIYIANKNMFL